MTRAPTQDAVELVAEFEAASRDAWRLSSKVLTATRTRVLARRDAARGALIHALARQGARP